MEELFRYYFWIAAIVSFVFISRVPKGDQDLLGAVLGNVMVAVLLGWLFWPLLICAGLGINLREQWQRLINKREKNGG